MVAPLVRILAEFILCANVFVVLGILGVLGREFDAVGFDRRKL